MKYTKIVILLILLFGSVACNNEANPNSTINNNSGKVINEPSIVLKNKTVDGLELNDLKVIYENGETLVKGNIKNITNDLIELDRISIDLLDENDESFVQVFAYIGDYIAAGETKNILVSNPIDSSACEAVNFRVISKEEALSSDGL